jgi:hypothetical protein
MIAAGITIYRLTVVVLLTLLISCTDPSIENDIGSDIEAAPSMPSTSITGKVIDGYIAIVTVFIDLNKNFILDENEPYTTTNEKGEYTLEVAEEHKIYPLIACTNQDSVYLDTYSPANADTSFCLSAPPILYSKTSTNNITPLTTMVHSRMEQDKVSINDAKAAVKKDLKVLDLPSDFDLDSDYIALAKDAALTGKSTEQLKFAKIHVIARIMTNLMQKSATTIADIDKDSALDSQDKLQLISYNYTVLADNLANIVTKVASEELDESLQFSLKDPELIVKEIDADSIGGIPKISDLSRWKDRSIATIKKNIADKKTRRIVEYKAAKIVIYSQGITKVHANLVNFLPRNNIIPSISYFWSYGLDSEHQYYPYGRSILGSILSYQQEFTFTSDKEEGDLTIQEQENPIWHKPEHLRLTGSLAANQRLEVYLSDNEYLKIASEQCPTPLKLYSNLSSLLAHTTRSSTMQLKTPSVSFLTHLENDNKFDIPQLIDALKALNGSIVTSLELYNSNDTLQDENANIDSLITQGGYANVTITINSQVITDRIDKYYFSNLLVRAIVLQLIKQISLNCSTQYISIKHITASQQHNLAQLVPQIVNTNVTNTSTANLTYAEIALTDSDHPNALAFLLHNNYLSGTWSCINDIDIALVKDQDDTWSWCGVANKPLHPNTYPLNILNMLQVLASQYSFSSYISADKFDRTLQFSIEDYFTAIREYLATDSSKEITDTIITPSNLGIQQLNTDYILNLDKISHIQQQLSADTTYGYANILRQIYFKITGINIDTSIAYQLDIALAADILKTTCRYSTIQAASNMIAACAITKLYALNNTLGQLTLDNKLATGFTYYKDAWWCYGIKANLAGYCIYSNILYNNGIAVTGTAITEYTTGDGETYLFKGANYSIGYSDINGYKYFGHNRYNGVFAGDNKLYQAGIKHNGVYTDNSLAKWYIEGVLENSNGATVVHDGKLYTDGVFDASDGADYLHNDDIYYDDGVQETGYIIHTFANHPNIYINGVRLTTGDYLSCDTIINDAAASCANDASHTYLYKNGAKDNVLDQPFSGVYYDTGVKETNLAGKYSIHASQLYQNGAVANPGAYVSCDNATEHADGVVCADDATYAYLYKAGVKDNVLDQPFAGVYYDAGVKETNLVGKYSIHASQLHQNGVAVDPGTYVSCDNADEHEDGVVCVDDATYAYLYKDGVKDIVVNQLHVGKYYDAGILETGYVLHDGTNLNTCDDVSSSCYLYKGGVKGTVGENYKHTNNAYYDDDGVLEAELDQLHDGKYYDLGILEAGHVLHNGTNGNACNDISISCHLYKAGVKGAAGNDYKHTNNAYYDNDGILETEADQLHDGKYYAAGILEIGYRLHDGINSSTCTDISISCYLYKGGVKGAAGNDHKHTNHAYYDNDGVLEAELDQLHAGKYYDAGVLEIELDQLHAGKYYDAGVLETELDQLHAGKYYDAGVLETELDQLHAGKYYDAGVLESSYALHDGIASSTCADISAVCLLYKDGIKNIDENDILYTNGAYYDAGELEQGYVLHDGINSSACSAISTSCDLYKDGIKNIDENDILYTNGAYYDAGELEAGIITHGTALYNTGKIWNESNTGYLNSSSGLNYLHTNGKYYDDGVQETGTVIHYLDEKPHTYHEGVAANLATYVSCNAITNHKDTICTNDATYTYLYKNGTQDSEINTLFSSRYYDLGVKETNLAGKYSIHASQLYQNGAVANPGAYASCNSETEHADGVTCALNARYAYLYKAGVKDNVANQIFAGAYYDTGVKEINAAMEHTIHANQLYHNGIPSIPAPYVSCNSETEHADNVMCATDARYTYLYKDGAKDNIVNQLHAGAYYDAGVLETGYVLHNSTNLNTCDDVSSSCYLYKGGVKGTVGENYKYTNNAYYDDDGVLEAELDQLHDGKYYDLGILEAGHVLHDGSHGNACNYIHMSCYLYKAGVKGAAGNDYKHTNNAYYDNDGVLEIEADQLHDGKYYAAGILEIGYRLHDGINSSTCTDISISCHLYKAGVKGAAGNDYKHTNNAYYDNDGVLETEEDQLHGTSYYDAGILEIGYALHDGINSNTCIDISISCYLYNKGIKGGGAGADNLGDDFLYVLNNAYYDNDGILETEEDQLHGTSYYDAGILEIGYALHDGINSSTCTSINAACLLYQAGNKNINENDILYTNGAYYDAGVLETGYALHTGTNSGVCAEGSSNCKLYNNSSIDTSAMVVYGTMIYTNGVVVSNSSLNYLHSNGIYYDNGVQESGYVIHHVDSQATIYYDGSKITSGYWSCTTTDNHTNTTCTQNSASYTYSYIDGVYNTGSYYIIGGSIYSGGSKQGGYWTCNTNTANTFTYYCSQNSASYTYSYIDGVYNTGSYYIIGGTIYSGGSKQGGYWTCNTNTANTYTGYCANNTSSYTYLYSNGAYYTGTGVYSGYYFSYGARATGDSGGQWYTNGVRDYSTAHHNGLLYYGGDKNGNVCYGGNGYSNGVHITSAYHSYCWNAHEVWEVQHRCPQWYSCWWYDTYIRTDYTYKGDGHSF